MRRSVVNDLLRLHREMDSVITTSIEEECMSELDENYIHNLERRLSSIVANNMKWLKNDIKKLPD